MTIEADIEHFFVNFPNLIADELLGRNLPVTNEFGEVNVCVEQGCIPECDGRIDLAFITEKTVHLVELKAEVINKRTLQQFRRYREQIQARYYPKHKILGYLVGRECRDMILLEEGIGSEPIKILRLGIEIPGPSEVIRCESCGAGVRCDKRNCPYCGNRLQVPAL
jgi:hypothetical protein